ncbi:MAG: galactose-1-phosphate uridylyltransferase [Firmicutes bacterium]|nr:galactose-1-phosphate uridylyltransferase [Bacillota bacterium]
MAEFRRDRVTGRWVIMAAEQSGQKAIQSPADREIRVEELPATVGNCPYCRGNENMTLPEIVAWREDGEREGEDGDWKVRVVPGGYPVPAPSGNVFSAERCGSGIDSGIDPGEIIIEAPQHNLHPGRFTLEQMETVVEAYHHRFAEFSRINRARSIILFRGHKEEGGVSMEHPHARVMALPFVYPILEEEFRGARRYYLARGGCVFCSILREELRTGERIVVENDEFVALSPYAAATPYEVWILPRRHSPSFREIRPEQIAPLAAIMCQLMAGIFSALDDPPYHYYLHSAPLAEAASPFYHWHLEIVPRFAGSAGFERGTGVYINTVFPEEAARVLAQTEAETFA